jgi:NDP-sugar pyrophosphorylase family protein
MLKAVILAGGRGVRLRPLTDMVPKPMIEIKGKPFLGYQLELLKKSKISEILLCVGYLKEKIMDYFGDGSKFGLKIDYSLEDYFLGTGGALKIAKDLLSETFLLLYGDSYLPIDYTELINACPHGDDAGLVVCYDNKTKIANNNIYLDCSGLIRRYDKRHPDRDMNYVEAGVAILKKEILGMIPEGKAVSLEEEIFPALIKQGRLKGYPTSQRYYDIGTLEGLKEIENLFS